MQTADEFEHAAPALAQLALERKLGALPRREPVTCTPSASVGEVLQLMQKHRVGSVVVLDDAQQMAGIFTRKDVLSRVALPQASPTTPITELMTRDVRSLDAEQTVEDAVLLTSRHGIRHVPVLENGRLINVVSERDLFALQRLSVKQISSAARAVADVAGLQMIAEDIRALARTLLGQGLQARSLTALISHLNDVLTARLLVLVAKEQDLDLNAACWLAFGSEGRSEQTIATDQDNGLIFVSDQPQHDRPRWLAFGRRVNQALDALGYPLCKGGIMAGEPECCLSEAEWQRRFAQWIEQGTPENLLKANIFFDFRPLAGRLELGQQLREFVMQRVHAVSLFHKQMADDILRRRAPLNWFGRIATEKVDGLRTVDLKLRGTALFVDAARVMSLAQGIGETGTRARFEAVARARGLEPQRAESWSAAFEFLQMLRLRVQLDRKESPGWVPGHPNKVQVAALNQMDRRLLKEALRLAEDLQQRLRLDYGG